MRNSFNSLLLLLIVLALGCNTKPKATVDNDETPAKAAYCRCEASPKPEATPIQPTETKPLTPFEKAGKYIISVRGDLASAPIDSAARTAQIDALTAIQEAQKQGDNKLADELNQRLKQQTDALVLKVWDYKRKSAEIETARRQLSLAIDDAIVTEREIRQTLDWIGKIVETYKSAMTGIQKVSAADYIGTLHRLRCNERIAGELLDTARQNLAVAIDNLKKEEYKGFINMSLDPTWEKVAYTEARLKPILETRERSRKETDPFFKARRSESEKEGIKGLSDSQLLADNDIRRRVEEIEDVIAKRLLDEK